MKKLADEQRFVDLSWRILERKFAYYHPEQVHKSWKMDVTVPDALYDAEEGEYRHLAAKLGRPASAADAVGFPMDRPSGKLVMKKLTTPKPKGVS
jgi:hypothetical protein